jgi:hypothetical protein
MNQFQAKFWPHWPRALFYLLFRAPTLSLSLRQSLELSLELPLKTRSLLSVSLAREKISRFLSAGGVFCNRQSMRPVSCIVVAGRTRRQATTGIGGPLDRPRSTSLSCSTPPLELFPLSPSKRCLQASAVLALGGPKHAFAVPEAARASCRLVQKLDGTQKLRSELARYDHYLSLPLFTFSLPRSACVMGCVCVRVCVCVAL